MAEAPKSADIPARFAVVGVLVALGFAYYLGAERAGEVRFAVEGVRAHETRLAEHERRIAAGEATLGAHGRAITAAAGRLDGHDRALEGHASAIEGHERRLAATDQGLAALEKKAAEAAAAIAAEAQARKLAEAKLEDLRAEVARLARELGLARGEIERRDADMTSLLERVARLERALAAQAER